MKYSFRRLVLTAIVGLACSLKPATAQNALSSMIAKELALRQANQYSLFSVSTERNENIDKAIRNVVYLKLNTEQFNRLRTENASLLDLEIPTGDGAGHRVQLMQYDFRTQDYRNVIKTAAGYQAYDEVGGKFYRGAIKNATLSMAAFSFYEDELGAVFSEGSQGNYNLVLNRENPGAHNENYILYKEADILDASPAACAVTDDALAVLKKSKKESPAAMGVYETNCNAVRVSVFADSFIYAYNARSVVKSVQYINTVFNVIAALYANDRLFLQLSETVVSTVKEGYSFSSSSTVLARFGNLMQTYTYNGDVAQCVTGYRNSGGSSPLGGLAWLDVLCTSPSATTISGNATYYGPYSMANTQVMTTIPSLPTYSWDVEVCAHELGHNIGSPHTQNCGWPGGPIDNCVAPEGGCSTVGPAPVGGGTVMSYCHLKAGVGINFAKGFGPLPTALLQGQMMNAVCLRSGVPDSTLQYASRVVVANSECFDGIWTHYFYDNNTADPSDDIYVMSISKGTNDIGSVTDKDFILKMTTSTVYASGSVPKLIVAYADTNWAEVNRKWTVQLPAGKQPVTAVGARYPYLSPDVQDIRSFASPTLINDTSLTFLKYATTIPVSGTAPISAGDVRKLKFSASTATPKVWRTGSTALYRYAEVLLDSGIYGGTLGYQRIDKTSIGNFEGETQLSVYPNPVTQLLHIDLPGGGQSTQLVTVFDPLGRIVIRQQLKASQGHLSIDLSTLSAGVYTLQCEDFESKEKRFTMLVKE